MTLLIIIFCIWGASALIRASREAKRQSEIDRINAENKRRADEAARMRQEWRERQAEAKAETARLIALEREQMRQAKEQERLAKEQEKQAAQLAKHEKRIADLEYRMEQAEEDINNLAWRIEEQQKYSEFLQEQRDKCSVNSAEYFKWQNKLTTVDNKVYQLDKQMRKAMHTRDMAKKELEVA